MQAGTLSPFSRVWLFETPWTITHQPPLSMRFSRQEYWSELTWSSRESPQRRDWAACLMSPALAGGFFTTSATWEGPQNRRQVLFSTGTQQPVMAKAPGLTWGPGRPAYQVPREAGNCCRTWGQVSPEVASGADFYFKLEKDTRCDSTWPRDKWSFKSWLELAPGMVQTWKVLEAEKCCCLGELIESLIWAHLWVQSTRPDSIHERWEQTD